MGQRELAARCEEKGETLAVCGERESVCVSECECE